MSLNQFINKEISSWLREEGPEQDIVLSTRIRLARNFAEYIFPIVSKENELQQILDYMKKHYHGKTIDDGEKLKLIEIGNLSSMEKKVLVEKHLISPYLAKSKSSAVLVSDSEEISVMVNEEDHIRMQLYLPGFQLKRALQQSFLFDDWLEQTIDFAFDETKGYLTSCPTNVGTGMRASVMVHLPALVFTKQINRMIPAINQLGFVVRGIYGEGSEALGGIFQVSNQITLGQSEEDIVDDLERIIQKIIEQERHARIRLKERTGIQIENQVYRSYGILKHARIMDANEAATRISNVRLGIDLGIITDVKKIVLNELMVLTQPGFLQLYADKQLNHKERDVLRATMIRERLNNGD